jgi:hypothetical protein
MASLFRQSLSDLRQRFAAGAERHPELRCVMAQTTDLAGDSDHLLQCARALDLGEPASHEAAFWWEVRSGKYERLGGKGLRVRVLKPARYWHIQYCGDEEGSRLFTALAEQAGECLPPQAHPAFCRLPKGFRDGGATGAKRWLFLVFHLAWSGTDSTPLRAWRRRGGRRRTEADDDARPFWSALPTDPFQASVAAIDILLAHVPDEDFDPYRELVHTCDWYIDQIVTHVPQRDVRDWAGIVERLWGQARLIGGAEAAGLAEPVVSTPQDALAALGALKEWAESRLAPPPKGTNTRKRKHGRPRQYTPSDATLLRDYEASGVGEKDFANARGLAYKEVRARLKRAREHASRKRPKNG